MVAEQLQTLCSTCQAIDFQHLFRDLTSRSFVEEEASLVLNKSPGLQSPSCRLCAFFFDMLPEEERNSCKNVSIFRIHRSTRNGSTNPTELNAPTMKQRTGLLVESNKRDQSWMDQTFVNYSKGSETPILIDPDNVNYESLRKWCDIVQKISRDPMDVLPVSVIDCHKREIVPVLGPCDYIALSYVWGPAAAQEVPTKGRSLPATLPRTVEDAITVVRELGLQYLWVDRYCLDQSNKAEFKAQLDQMADIYRHALMTIIAAAGSDADYGLPGVSSRKRIKQPRVKVGDYTLWSSMTDPRKLVRESVWTTRAWTYQEAVFSWNWIAFTDEQVFFQRSNKEWANMERWWKVSCEMFPHGGLGAEPNCPLLQMFDNVWKNEGAIHDLLCRYTARKLTYQSDALNGALGLLKRCENGPYCMNHYFGIPILGPLIYHRKASGRDSDRSWSMTEAFLTNLCWKAKGTGPRRSGFPSWSWTGWHAVYSGPLRSLACFGLSVMSLVDAKLFLKGDQGLIDWETKCNTTKWDVYEDFASFPQELFIQAPTVGLTISKDPQLFSDTKYGHAADMAPMKWFAIFSDEECDVLIEVDLVDVKVETMLPDTGTMSAKGILLRQLDPALSKNDTSNTRFHEIWAFALIVLEEQTGFTRVGSLELRRDNYFVRWKPSVEHLGWENSKVAGIGKLKDYVDCSECRMKALELLARGKKEELVKLL